MSSPINGVYGLMKTNWKLLSLIFQHCSAHRLQLVAGPALAKMAPRARSTFRRPLRTEF